MTLLSNFGNIDITMLDQLFTLHTNALERTTSRYKRYLYSQINWNYQLNMIIGMRGVGKTTMLHQYIQENYPKSQEVLYIMADNPIVNSFGLFAIGQEFYQHSGKLLVIDEIHKYPNWRQEIKSLFDSFPKLKLLISGSSSLDIIKGTFDLSRRAVVYHLKNLSFREYLNLKLETDQFSVIKLTELFNNHLQLATKITKQLRKLNTTILNEFQIYLKNGCYPYFIEGISDYQNKLSNAISKVIYEDIPSVFNVKISIAPILQKMLYLVATSDPFIPNVARMASTLGVSKATVYNYLDYLYKSDIFQYLWPADSGIKMIRKPQKIFLNNSNLYIAITGKESLKQSVGSIRESFTINQLIHKNKVIAHDKGDIIVNGKYIFEIGGKSKTLKQIAKIDNSYVLKDNVELGFDRIIPLWLVGFLY